MTVGGFGARFSVCGAKTLVDSGLHRTRHDMREFALENSTINKQKAKAAPLNQIVPSQFALETISVGTQQSNGVRRSIEMNDKMTDQRSVYLHYILRKFVLTRSLTGKRSNPISRPRSLSI